MKNECSNCLHYTKRGKRSGECSKKGDVVDNTKTGEKEFRKLRVLSYNSCFAFELKQVKVMDSLNTKLKIGQKIKVCGDLETIITRIEGDKYYFNDADGQEWSEVIDAIELIN